MKITIRVTASVILAALIGAGSVFAQDPPNFDFLAFPPSVPTQTGSAIQVFGIVNNNGAVPTPIPLDFVNNEYTVVITGTLMNTVGITQLYTLVQIDVYADAAKNADFANQTTFSDGTLILSGSVSGTLNRNSFTPTLGNFIANVDWTGGTRVGELGSNTTNWGMGGGISGSSGTIPSGYAEAWDGKIDQPVVAVESETWSGVKSLYQK